MGNQAVTKKAVAEMIERRKPLSPQVVESILSRAMNDAEFVEQLFANPDKALAGYNLSAEETAQIKKMTRSEFNSMMAEMPESLMPVSGSNLKNK